MDILALILIATIVKGGEGQQQYFRVKPKDLKVHEGGEALLECEVSHLAGSVQWTKDGFALGFNSVIPGFPRYSMIGDPRSGVFNLRIQNASLDDDADFQCQVGPSSSHKPIRESCRLSVISPPSVIEIVGHQGGTKIEIKENQEFQLECLAKNSKPAARIVWYRKNVELKPEKREDKTTEVDIPSKKAKRFNVSSKIRLKPTAEDDGAEYSCEAKHEALPPDQPLRVSVHLSVFYPPGTPYIEGYTEGETIKKGMSVELVCRSRGGNPPAQLIWYRNGEQVHIMYRTQPRLSENVLSFTAEPKDDKAKYRCEASNVMSSGSLKAEITLSVFFAPTQVTINGPTEARVGDMVGLSCVTAASNPPADVKWVVGGRQVKNATQRTVPDPAGGWVTSSNTTAVIAPEQKSLVVICHGINRQLTENIVSTHTINILYPPEQLIVSGYEPGTHIAAGTVQKISCISYGGNPLATITWYKNDKKIPSSSAITDKSVSAEVTILTNVTDNGAIYKCEASNSATEIPMIETLQLSVHFPPDRLRIRVDPVDLRASTEATLECDATSSNPPAEMSWWADGIRVTEGVSDSSKAGLHGGVQSSIQLRLRVTPDLDGKVYTCQATNLLLVRSVHEAITMNVLYKPVWGESGGSVSGNEGQPLVLSPLATGHPPAITYSWMRDGSPLRPSSRLYVDGPLLNFTSLDRSDSGVYVCTAANSEGDSTIQYNLTVHYSAVVVEVSEGVLVSSGQDASLWCRVEGSPLSVEHVTWRRPGLDQSRASTAWRNDTAFLTLRKVTKDDIGHFHCVANNGLGNDSIKDVFLNVRHKPEMDLSPLLSKAASNNGDSAKLICRVSSAPPANFSWSREGNVIHSDFKKYLIDYQKVDAVHYESILKIRDVELPDYGLYDCLARNELGFATTSIKLSLTTAPDTPSKLRVVNTSHDSLTLAWDAGFDGGLQQSFRLRYKPSQSPSANYRYEDTGNATTYTVNNLDLGTQYVFSVMAQNRLGSSRYLPDTFKATTSNVAPPSLPSRGSGSAPGGGPSTLLVAGGVVGVALLLVNLVLVGCCLRRRSNKRLTGASEQGSNKSATIEMYAPSSYNETVTGETLSSVSEKSESYSDSNAEYTEENRKSVPGTYLIEPVDYQFQYPVYDIQHTVKDPDPLILPRNNYVTQNGGVDGYFGTLGGGDPRYIAYPPPVQFAGPPLAPPHLAPPHLAPPHLAPRGPAPGPPPDVTVLSAPPPPLMTTFNTYDHDAHLV